MPRKSDLQLAQNLEIEKLLDLIVSRDKIDLAESSLLVQKLGMYFKSGTPSSKSDTIIVKTEYFLSLLYDEADEGSGNEALKEAISNTQSYSSYLTHIIKQELDRKEIIRDERFYSKIKPLGGALIQLDLKIGLAKSRFKP